MDIRKITMHLMAASVLLSASAQAQVDEIGLDRQAFQAIKDGVFCSQKDLLRGLNNTPYHVRGIRTPEQLPAHILLIANIEPLATGCTDYFFKHENNHPVLGASIIRGGGDPYKRERSDVTRDADVYLDTCSDAGKLLSQCR